MPRDFDMLLDAISRNGFKVAAVELGYVLNVPAALRAWELFEQSGRFTDPGSNAIFTAPIKFRSKHPAKSMKQPGQSAVQIQARGVFTMPYPLAADQP